MTLIQKLFFLSKSAKKYLSLYLSLEQENHLLLLRTQTDIPSGWQDSNLRPPAPKAGAIPDYATPRKLDCKDIEILI